MNVGCNYKSFANLPVLGGLDGTGLESFDSAVTESTNDGRFVDTVLGIIIRDLQTNEHMQFYFFFIFSVKQNTTVTIQQKCRFDYAT